MGLENIKLRIEKIKRGLNYRKQQRHYYNCKGTVNTYRAGY